MKLLGNEVVLEDFVKVLSNLNLSTPTKVHPSKVIDLFKETKSYRYVRTSTLVSKMYVVFLFCSSLTM